MLVSNASAAVSGGSIDGRRAASMDFPAPGGPIISRLCAPAAAISSARLADSWPLTSLMSGNRVWLSVFCTVGKGMSCAPLKWLTRESRLSGATMLCKPDQAASEPLAAGQIRPLPLRLALTAAGRMPLTESSEPSSPSSPRAI